MKIYRFPRWRLKIQDGRQIYAEIRVYKPHISKKSDFDICLVHEKEGTYENFVYDIICRIMWGSQINKNKYVLTTLILSENFVFMKIVVHI